MRSLLLLVVMLFGLTLAGQSTLMIYVVNGDSRSDMDIIDLNTNALDRYGASVDSTNINYYATTMSTQVLRMTFEELYGYPEEEVTVAGAEELVEFQEADSPILIRANVIEKQAITETAVSPPSPIIVSTPMHSGGSAVNNPTPVRTSGGDSYRSSDRKPRKKIKRGSVKKSRKYKKYKGRCPKFF